MMRPSTIAIALVLATAPARGEPSTKAQAKQHFKQGKALQDAGKYDDAVAEYRAAYDLDRRPEMLFNIAQVYRLENHKQPAIDYYQQYLAVQPDGPGAREARQWIAELTRQIEVDRPLPIEPAKPEPPPMRIASFLRCISALAPVARYAFGPNVFRVLRIRIAKLAS
jgi:iron complex outermembrane receptor protein